MTQRAVLGTFTILVFSLFAATATGQFVYRSPTPTPTPKPPIEAPQNATPAPCPTVAVLVQGQQVIRDGQPIAFMANIAGGDPKIVPTIVWSTSAGLVSQGQGTRRIQVDSTGAGGTFDREIKAEVWVGGYAPECVLQAGATVKVIAPAAKFGEFGEVDAQTLKTNLDALASFLSQSPDNLYLIAYAGRNSERGYTYTWLKKIKDSLVAAGIESRRVYTVDGGFREQPLFDFWTVPAGAIPPQPTPTIKRTDIIFPRTVPPKKP
jgi:hypothetical protein